MIIKELSVRFLDEPNREPISFNKCSHFIVSEENSKGKTTLMRLIAFSLCFRLSMTKGLRTSKFETTALIERDGLLITLIRVGDSVRIIRTGNEICLNLKNSNDFKSVLSYVFGIDKTISGDDLLGTIYLDQDNGWNLLSSGKVIGDTKFSASNAIESLFAIDTADIDRQIAKLDRDIKKYQLVKDAVETKNNEVNDTSYSFTSKESKRDSDLILLHRNYLQRRKETLKSKIQYLTDVIESKKSIESYIDELGIMVKENADSKPFRLTKNNLFLSQANLDGIRAQKMIYESELRNIYKELSSYNSIIKNESIEIVNVEHSSQAIEKFLQEIPNLSISEIKANQDSLRKEKERLVSDRRALLKEGDSSQFLDDFEKEFKEHLKHFGMFEEVYNDEKIKIEYYLNRGKFSGAELAKVVLSYRLAFHKSICKATKTKFPIFIDSPGSKELKTDVVVEIINYVVNYGKNNGFQTFVSTVNIDSIALDPGNHNTLTGKAIDLFKESGLV